MNLIALLNDAKTQPERREAILALERAALALPPGSLETAPLRHHFAPGQYAREIFLKANTLTGGKLHRHAHVNILSMGRCLVYTEFGTELLVAPETFISQPGTKRVVLPLEDIVWTTVHANPTDSRDIAWIEQQIIAPSYEAIGMVELPRVTA